MTIVEAEEIVPVGTFDPNHVHLPGVLYVFPLAPHISARLTRLERICSVNRVVQSTTAKRVEVEVLRDDGNSGTDKSEAAQRRDRIAKRAAKELKEGVSSR